MKRTTTLLFATIFYSLIACNNTAPNTDSASETSTIENASTRKISLEFVLHDSITINQVSSIKGKLELNADSILEAFRIKSIDTFKIHVWANYENYLIAQESYTGQRYDGSRGYVIDTNNLAMFMSPNIAEIAEHEFIHAISLRLNSSLPRWLWESVAIYGANEFVDPNELSYLRNGSFPTLAELNTDFNESNHTIYSVGYIISEFIIHQWGTEKYYELIKQGGNLNKVLAISESEFETEWAAFVKEKYIIESPTEKRIQYKIKK